MLGEAYDLEISPMKNVELLRHKFIQKVSREPKLVKVNIRVVD